MPERSGLLSGAAAGTSSGRAQLPISLRLEPLNPRVGDIDYNEGLIAAAIARAVADGIELLALPELVVCGYPCDDLLLRRDFLDRCHTTVSKLAALTEGTSTAVVLGTPQLLGGALYNAVALLADGKASYPYRKQQLPNGGVYSERRYFRAGHTPAVQKIKGRHIALSVCADLWDDGEPTSTIHARHAELLVNLSASPYRRGKPGERRSLLLRRVEQTGCPIAYVSMSGGQDTYVFDGHSMIAAPGVGIVAESAPFDGACLSAPAGPIETQKQAPVAGDEELRQLWQALSVALRDYVGKNGFERVLLGLSGGLDSAIVLLLAVGALGADRVLAATMPSSFSSQAAVSDAHALARALGVSCREIPITGPLRSCQDVLATTQELTSENLQARLRGLLLMALSNECGALVLCCSNKSESAVGYATLYGDTVGGFAPLGDVFKSELYELADWLLGRAGDHVSRPLASIIARPPSAELREGQRDADDLPAYEVLDPLLRDYIEDRCSADQLAARGHDPALISTLIARVERNEFKRRQSPPAPRISKADLRSHRRMPISSGFFG